MVEVGVAVKIDQEIMYDQTKAITSDRSKMVGRPTMYVLTTPERVVFIVETGCNENCKSEGYPGSQKHVCTVYQVEGGRLGATTDMHFTVMAFTSGAGEPIMCTVILKSNKETKDLPLGSTMGIDMTRNIQLVKQITKLTSLILKMMHVLVVRNVGMMAKTSTVLFVHLQTLVLQVAN